MDDIQQLMLKTLLEISESNKEIKAELVRLNGRIDALERRLDALERRLAALEARMDTMEARLDAMEARMEAMDAKIEQFRRELRQEMAEQTNSLRAEMTAGFNRLEQRMDSFERSLDLLALQLPYPVKSS